MIGSDRMVAKHTQNIPWVISMHGCYEAGLASDANFASKAAKILKKADGLIYAAEKNLNVLNAIDNLGLLPNRNKVYYGINEAPLLNTDKTDNKLVFGMVARSIPSKGWMQTLTAFKDLTTKFPDRELEFLVVADESEYFRELAIRYGDVRGIKFLGFRLDPSGEISDMDVCLLPTFFPGESLPNSIIEYLRAGKPVIATDIGEISNMINVDGEIAGFLIPISKGVGGVDSCEIMSCMEQYVKENKLLTKHGLLATQAFGKFSLDRCMNDYLDFFSRTMQFAGKNNFEKNTVKSQ